MNLVVDRSIALRQTHVTSVADARATTHALDSAHYHQRAIDDEAASARVVYLHDRWRLARVVRLRSAHDVDRA